MATGVYGNTRPADVSIEDISMYYNYTPNRYTANNTMYTLDPTELLEYCYLPSDDPNFSGNEDLLEGLYNLKLPASTFNQVGIYTVYIKPKVNVTTIIDCSVLSALPSVSGIVIDSTTIPEELRANNALQGFRVEYIDSDGNKTRNVVRYVVTSNKASVTTENVGNTSQKAQRYYFDDSGTLLFLQLTPSSASDVKPNATPFIGNIGQTILLSNTYFKPIVIEIDLVRNTIDTLSDFITGDQVKDAQKGILTHYDKDKIITKQYDLFEIKDDVTDVPLFEVKKERTTIDTTQNQDDVLDGVQ
jgi:hypothetical protein